MYVENFKIGITLGYSYLIISVCLDNQILSIRNKDHVHRYGKDGLLPKGADILIFVLGGMLNVLKSGDNIFMIITCVIHV